jgi:hypothetical protein
MKKILTVCLFVVVSAQTQTGTFAQKIESNVDTAADRVNTIWQSMEDMRHNVEDMFQEFAHRFAEEITDLQNLASNTWEKISSTDDAKLLRITISEENKDVVSITIDGIVKPAKDEGFTASISYDAEDKPSKLVVSNTGQEITIVYKSKFNHLAVSVSQERSVKRTDEDGNVVSERQSMTNKSYGQTIASEIMLDEPVIDYIAEEQKLVISVPKVMPTEKKKSVQVNVK